MCWDGMAANQVLCHLFETHAGFCIGCSSEQLKIMFVGYFFCLVLVIPHGTVELLIHTQHADLVKDTLLHSTSTCVLRCSVKAMEATGRVSTGSGEFGSPFLTQPVGK